MQLRRERPRRRIDLAGSMLDPRALDRPAAITACPIRQATIGIALEFAGVALPHGEARTGTFPRNEAFSAPLAAVCPPADLRRCRLYARRRRLRYRHRGLRGN